MFELFIVNVFQYIFIRITWAKNRDNICNAKVTEFSPAPGSSSLSAHCASSDPVETAQLHFSFISKQTVFVVTEATIRDVFSHFGFVQDVSIKKTAVEKVNRRLV
jgi:hypothetical protein